METQGQDQIEIPMTAQVKFSHPLNNDPRWIPNGPLFINSGVNSVKWSYELITQTTPTIGGEVVQILSCFVGPISIQGEAIGYLTGEGADNPTAGWNRQVQKSGEEGTSAYTPTEEMMNIMRWFRSYMHFAGTDRHEHRVEDPVLFEYPDRGWSFYIQPTGFEGFKMDKTMVTVPWSITAEVVSDAAADYFKKSTMSGYTDTLTLSSARMLQRAISGDGTNAGSITLQGDNFAGQAHNIFTDPKLGYDRNVYATQLATNYHLLVASYLQGDFKHFGYASFPTDKQFSANDLDKIYSEIFHNSQGGFLGTVVPGVTPGFDTGSGSTSFGGGSGSDSTPPPPPPPGGGGTSGCQPTADEINAVLAGSPMHGLGNAFLNAGVKNGITASFLVGLAAQETSLGRNLQLDGPHGGTFNAFNWGGVNFSSWEEGINTVAKGLTGSSYIGHNPPRVSVADIYLGVYCGSGCHTGEIISAMNTLHGNVNDVRCGVDPTCLYKNPFRSVTNLYPARIDNGVDYAGTHGDPIYAIGPATVTYYGPDDSWGAESVPSAGARIGYTFTCGAAKGLTVYIAEYISLPSSVRLGSTLTSDTVVARFGGPGVPGSFSGDGIETGWATGPGNPNPLANAFGGQTDLGTNFSQLLESLGAPPGKTDPRGHVGNPLPAGWPTWS